MRMRKPSRFRLSLVLLQGVLLLGCDSKPSTLPQESYSTAPQALTELPPDAKVVRPRTPPRKATPEEVREITRRKPPEGDHAYVVETIRKIQNAGDKAARDALVAQYRERARSMKPLDKHEAEQLLEEILKTL